MPETQEEEGSTGLIDVRPDSLARVAVLGLLLGVVIWGLTMLLNQYVITPIFCANQPGNVCSDTLIVAGNVALVMGAIAGVLGLVRLGTYRPMLVAIAVGICLWGLSSWVKGIIWYEALGWTALLYMLAYVAFTWLVRPRNFVVVLFTLLIVILSARVVSIL